MKSAVYCNLECLAKWIGCLLFMQGVEGSTPTGGTCQNDFSNPIDQDIHSQCALSWKIVVSEWRSVSALSLNVGGGVHPTNFCKFHSPFCSVFQFFDYYEE